MQDEQSGNWSFRPEASPGSTISPGANAASPQNQPAEHHEPPAEPANAEPESPNSSIRGSGENTVNWTASEFVEHQKSAGWYIWFMLALALGLGAMYFITRDLISLVAIGSIAIVFMIAANRKPRTLSYSVDSRGVQVGAKKYFYNNFKAFAVVNEGAMHSIMLLPLQRFMPSISLYYDPRDEEKIVDALADALPMEERKQDSVDRLMRKIRF